MTNAEIKAKAFKTLKTWEKLALEAWSATSITHESAAALTLSRYKQLNARAQGYIQALELMGLQVVWGKDGTIVEIVEA